MAPDAARRASDLLERCPGQSLTPVNAQRPGDRPSWPPWPVLSALGWAHTPQSDSPCFVFLSRPLSVADRYTRLLRDEVLADWCDGGLHVHCHVKGHADWWLAPSVLRLFIFRREMNLVLDAFRYADSSFLEDSPGAHRCNAPVCRCLASAPCFGPSAPSQSSVSSLAQTAGTLRCTSISTTLGREGRASLNLGARLGRHSTGAFT